MNKRGNNKQLTILPDKRTLLCFIFLLFPLFFYSQGEWNIWYFGEHAGLDFNSGSPVPLTNCAPSFNIKFCPISVADSIGNLLFYADVSNTQVSTVYNRNHVPMPNGSYLATEYGVHQPLFAVKKLDDDSSYYLFTMDYGISSGYPNAKGLTYSIVDMRLDGGLGDIVAGQKNIQIPGAAQASIMLSGTRHHNNQDVWITVRKYLTSNSFLSYLITSAGINSIPVISNSLIYTSATNGNSMIKFSPDGTRLVCLYDSVGEFCNFNSATGQITPLFPFKTILPLTVYSDCSAEFSIDSRYLYITIDAGGHGKVYQYDATETDSAQFKQSEIFIARYFCMGGRAWLQLGPDAKIYLTVGGIDSLSVINNPSLQYPGCNYQQNAICLLPDNLSMDGLPQFLQKYYVYIHHSNILCTGASTHFNSSIWPSPDSLHWDFGDPTSGGSDFSFLQNPSHIYSVPGSYTVTLFVRHIDNRTDTAWQVVNISPTYQPSLGPDRSICVGDSVTFNAGSCTGCSYQWINLSTGLPVGSGQTFTTGQAGLYEVTVTNTNGCTGRDTIQLTTNALPSVTNNPLSKTICSGESTNISLTSNETGTNFYWTATLTSGNINGFSADSGLIINQILTNNGSSAGIVTYHITPKVGSCSGTAVDFPVTVDVGDSVKVSISASTNNVCAGTPVTFIATPTNGGSSPSYQWKVNGNNVGINSPGYIYNPASGDLVSCILTSSITVCISNNPATSNTIQMVVNPLNPVGITISPSANPVCAGTQVTFTANPINPGTSPVFQWKVNAANMGTNSLTYSYIPVSGDQVSCILTSNATCATGNPATSNTVTMTVNQNMPVSVSISASLNPVCSGIPVNFTAMPVNGGSTPVYQWQVNGGNAGSNSSLYQYTPLNGDLVNCLLTSNLNCTTGNPATSNTITMNVSASPVVTFIACFDTITTTNAQPFKLKGGIPLGGTYSGAGVTNGIFYPAIAGVGTHQINYTYTNVALCTVTDHRSLITINPIPFTCGNPITDVRDNKVYPTVQIGSQCWIAEDLNYGTEIPADLAQRDNCLPEKYHNPASGILHPASVYQWDELMQYDETVSNQGLCPPGWHIPAEADWNALFANYINNAFAASPLKYSGFSGFNALLSGARHMNKTWDFQGFATFFWSSTTHGTNKAWAHGMNDTDPSVSLYPAFRSNAFSVRCLKD